MVILTPIKYFFFRILNTEKQIYYLMQNFVEDETMRQRVWTKMCTNTTIYSCVLKLRFPNDVERRIYYYHKHTHHCVCAALSLFVSLLTHCWCHKQTAPPHANTHTHSTKNADVECLKAKKQPNVERKTKTVIK